MEWSERLGRKLGIARPLSPGLVTMCTCKYAVREATVDTEEGGVTQKKPLRKIKIWGNGGGRAEMFIGFLSNDKKKYTEP